MDELVRLVEAMRQEIRSMNAELAALRSEIHSKKLSCSWLDMKEACEFLHISKSTMKNRMYEGEFPWAVKKGRKWMFPAEKLRKYAGNTAV